MCHGTFTGTVWAAPSGTGAGTGSEGAAGTSEWEGSSDGAVQITEGPGWGAGAVCTVSARSASRSRPVYTLH